jgi:hypothetical protein
MRSLPMNTLTKPLRTRRLPLLLAGAALAAALVVAGQQAARRRSIEHSQSHSSRAIAALPERAAAQHVHDLLSLDVEALPILVPLLADQRPLVADAAHEALADLLARWQRLPPGESSPRVARLARELAVLSPDLAESRRRTAHDLAARVLVWPLDPSAANAPQVVADCEAVLRLPASVTDEPRVAARPTPAQPAIVKPALAGPAPAAAPPVRSIPPVATAPLAAPLVEAPPPASPPPFYGRPAEPERLIDASRERPEEPRQIRPPRAIKIEG